MAVGMHLALDLWGYEIDAVTMLTSIVCYLAVSAVALVVIPNKIVPDPEYDRLNDEQKNNLPAAYAAQEKLIELRSKVRQPVLQFIGGATAVVAFIVTLQQIRQNEDTFKKAKADLFAKSLATLLDSKSQLNSRAEAMYLLSYVARSEPPYHRSVFDALSNHVVTLSAEACKAASSKATAFRKEPQIQIAMRILGERNPSHDPTGKRFNVEHACLTEIDLRDEYRVVVGLRNARLSNANMLRSDFTRADLRGTEMKGIIASDYLNPKWDAKKALDLHPGEKGDVRSNRKRLNGYERRQLITHFVDADLTGADFGGAELAGADFSGATLANASFQNANISRANFNGAQKLTAKQLSEACVGNEKMSKTELEQAQPYLWNDLRKAVGKSGIRNCIQNPM